MSRIEKIEAREIDKYDGYRITIGIEVHAELSTKTKAYCPCAQEFKAEPNSNICPSCMGLPGALPYFNEKVLEYAIKAGLATNSTITRKTKFDRKNYFYPDLVKGYQITQDDKPIARNGYLNIEVEEEGEILKKKIGIERIHMEEDTAKMIHDPFGRGTLIDFNRGGVPLIEIVSKPDIHRVKDAITYLETLRKLLIYLDIAECKMEEGGFRADVNISVSKTEELGNRAEIKNMNSFKAIERALEYEIRRQINLVEKGEKISQSTLRWDDVEGKTSVMRSKETAKDYRYFPESDLPVVEVSEEHIENIRRNIPELLENKKERYLNQYKLSDKQILFILSDNRYIEMFEETLKTTGVIKETANYLMTEIAAYVNSNVISPKDIKITNENYAKFINLLKDGVLNSKTAKVVIEEMLETGKEPKLIIEEKGLKQIDDEMEIIRLVEEVLQENPQSIEDIKNGKDRAIGFLVGMCMKRSAGKANPAMVNKLIMEKINK